MKDRFKNNFISPIVLLMLLGIFLGCKSHDTINEPDEPPVTIEKAENLHSLPGKNRIVLSWKISDPNVKRAVIYWDKKKDSIVVSNIGKDSIYIVIPNLNEDNYLFTVYLYDSQGHASDGVQVVGKVYGEKYLKSLLPRRVKNALYYNGDVNINWYTPSHTSIGTQVNFTDNNGNIKLKFISKENNNTKLINYKPGTFFKYRTAYIPEEGAIDTFYTAYKSTDEDNTFSNPLVENAPDPWVVKKDSMYYLTYTTVNKIVLRATKKMSEAGNVKPVTVWTPPSGTNHSNNIWAPEMYFLNGKWYIYFTADGDGHTHSMFVLENNSLDPMKGSWQYKGELKVAPGKFSIDGTILKDNGQLYMIWSLSYYGQYLYISKMSNPWTLEGNSSKIASPDRPWEQHGQKVLEAPEALRNKNGDLFLIYSASQCATDFYSLGMLSLRSGGNPLNPNDWTKSPDPVFTQSPSNDAYGPGHCSFFKSPDGTEDWIIYHANRLSGQGCGATRSSRMQQFTWNADGTPDFGTPVQINKPIETPSGEF